ncbi:MAG: lipopolysaccharide assembly protein LapB [Pseudomonadales bacterium]|jgi:lipopolysaccharide biosynthesis regulator YciM
MPDNIALYVLLVIALGIGYLLGRRERRIRPREIGMITEDYFKGLNHLLNERHDLAIDTFVESMAVDNDTVDTHLALGSLVRRRGEVDKAIRIHQNLLARPVLSAAHRTQTELELARDYLMAGLLGRAENLLKELAGKNGSERRLAEELLLEIYQREKDWEKAVEIGQELARANKSIRRQLAHFQCELAETALAAGNLRSARAALAKATGFDSRCARTSLIGAKIAFAEKRYREVQRQLARARELDPELAQETLALYQTAADELNDPDGLVRYLETCLESAPVLPVVERLAEHIEQREGVEVANEFVVEQLLRNPSLAGFVTLLNRLDRSDQPLPPEQLTLVRRFSQSLLQRQPAYRCRNCGFSGRTLMWQCPSCRTWGSIKPILHNATEEA